MKRLVYNAKKGWIWSDWNQDFNYSYGKTCCPKVSSTPQSVQLKNALLQNSKGEGLFTFPDGVDTGVRTYPNQIMFADITEIERVKNQLEAVKDKVSDELKDEIDKAQKSADDLQFKELQKSAYSKLSGSDTSDTSSE